MKTGLAVLLAVAVLAPAAFGAEANPRDEATTFLTIRAGGATYADVTRTTFPTPDGVGMSVTSQERSFRDIGIALERKITGPWRVGVRVAGFDNLPDKSGGRIEGWSWSPFVSLTRPGFSAGLGVLFVTDRWRHPLESNTGYAWREPGWEPRWVASVPPLTGHLRLGNPREGIAFMARLLEEVPMYSGNGAATAALGGPIGDMGEIWLGAALGRPYEESGFFMRATVHLLASLDLETSARIGSYQGIAERGIAAGLSYAFTPGF